MNDAFPSFFHCHLDDEYGEMESVSRGFRLRLDAMGIRYKSLHVGGNGAVFLNLSGTTISDLSPLTAFPLTHLCLQGCYEIADFSPLKDMNLIWLNLCRTKIMDLSPLEKMPLSHLDLHRTRTVDLLPLPDILKQGESQTVEFKESFQEEALQTIGAFANTQGGTLLIGVNDVGVPTGVTVGKRPNMPSN